MKTGQDHCLGSTKRAIKKCMWQALHSRPRRDIDFTLFSIVTFAWDQVCNVKVTSLEAKLLTEECKCIN